MYKFIIGSMMLLLPIFAMILYVLWDIVISFGWNYIAYGFGIIVWIITAFWLISR